MSSPIEYKRSSPSPASDRPSWASKNSTSSTNNLPSQGASRCSEPVGQPAIFNAIREVEIQGGRFNAMGHHTNLSFHFHQSNSAGDEPDAAGTEETGPAPELKVTSTRKCKCSLKQESAHELYVRHIIRHSKGYPLWITEPNKQSNIQYRRQGAAIGDVGVISPIGGFSYLFNMCLPADDCRNSSRLPSGFKPLEIDAEEIEMWNSFDRATFLASPNVHRVEDNPLSTDTMSFHASRQDGAIMVLPEGAESHEVTNISAFTSYVRENLESWYRFANGVRGRDLRNGDLRIVIGCDKASCCGLAALRDMSHGDPSVSNRRLKLNGFSDAFHPPSSATSQRGWDYTGSVEHRAVPHLAELAVLRKDDLDPPTDGRYLNHSVFLRTLNPEVDASTWSRLCVELRTPHLDSALDSPPDSDSTPHPDSPSMDSAPSSQHMPSSDQTSPAGRVINAAHSWSGNTASSPFVHETTCFLSVPDLTLGFTRLSAILNHPSKRLNRALMTKFPGARMVVTRDHDWFPLVNHTSLDLINALSDDDVIRLVEQDGISKIVLDKGCLYVHTRPQQLLQTKPDIAITDAVSSCTSETVEELPSIASPFGHEAHTPMFGVTQALRSIANFVNSSASRIQPTRRLSSQHVPSNPNKRKRTALSQECSPYFLVTPHIPSGPGSVRRRACQRCRDLNVRCESTSNIGGSCKRCLLGNHKCLIAARRARGFSERNRKELFAAIRSNKQKIESLQSQLFQISKERARIGHDYRFFQAISSVDINGGALNGLYGQFEHRDAPLSVLSEPTHGVGEDSTEVSTGIECYESLARISPAPPVLCLGIVTTQEADQLFKIYFDNINPSILLLDPVLYTCENTLYRSPFLFTVVCAIASRFCTAGARAGHHAQILHSARLSAGTALVNGTKNVEMVQAYILLSLYPDQQKSGEEQRSWLYLGLAIQVATDIDLHHPPTVDNTREALNRTRTWLTCFTLERRAGSQCKKPMMIDTKEYIANNSEQWYSTSPHNLQSCDIYISAYISELKVRDEFYGQIHGHSSYSSPLNGGVDLGGISLESDNKLQVLSEDWLSKINSVTNPWDPAVVYRSSLLKIEFGTSRLMVLSYWLRDLLARKYQRNLEILLARCIIAATGVIDAAVNGTCTPSQARLWHYAPESHKLSLTFSAAFLLKLLRPEFNSHVNLEEKGRIQILVRRVISIFDSPAAGQESKVYAQFLRGLLASIVNLGLKHTCKNATGSTP